MFMLLYITRCHTIMIDTSHLFNLLVTVSCSVAPKKTFLPEQYPTEIPNWRSTSFPPESKGMFQGTARTRVFATNHYRFWQHLLESHRFFGGLSAWLVLFDLVQYMHIPCFILCITSSEFCQFLRTNKNAKKKSAVRFPTTTR